MSACRSAKIIGCCDSAQEFSRHSHKRHLLQLLIVNLLLLTRSFESVVQYTQFSRLVCSLFTVLGVMVLRATRPGIVRPYRVWAYPMPPIIFAVLTLWTNFYLLRWKTNRIAGGTRHRTRWSAALLSARNNDRNALHENATLRRMSGHRLPTYAKVAQRRPDSKIQA